MKRLIAHSYTEVISLENLLAAWQEFVAGKNRRADVAAYAGALLTNVLALARELHDRSYIHGGYERFRIHDPKPRVINKASVRDRLLHRAIYRVLYPAFDTTFIFDSYSCRDGKGTHRAVRQLVRYTRQVSRNSTRPGWALKLDIRKFFDSIDHAILLELLRQRLDDPDLLALLTNIIESYAAGPGRGLPLGNLTSQLFANIYLDPLDKFVKHTLKANYYLRYADDFVIVAPTKTELERLLLPITTFLTERLKLSLHPKKIVFRKLRQGVDFLGYVVLPQHVVLRTRTKRRMLRRVTPNNLASYLGLLEHANAYRLTQQLKQRFPAGED